MDDSKPESLYLSDEKGVIAARKSRGTSIRDYIPHKQRRVLSPLCWNPEIEHKAKFWIAVDRKGVIAA